MNCKFEYNNVEYIIYFDDLNKVQVISKINCGGNIILQINNCIIKDEHIVLSERTNLPDELINHINRIIKMKVYL